jgi:hypothetical protein
MDVSDLRKRILRAIDDARKDASARRTVVDEAAKAFDTFLTGMAVPLMRQAVNVLRADRRRSNAGLVPGDCARSRGGPAAGDRPRQRRPRPSELRRRRTSHRRRQGDRRADGRRRVGVSRRGASEAGCQVKTVRVKRASHHEGTRRTRKVYFLKSFQKAFQDLLFVVFVPFVVKGSCALLSSGGAVLALPGVSDSFTGIPST